MIAFLLASALILQPIAQEPVLRQAKLSFETVRRGVDERARPLSRGKIEVEAVVTYREPSAFDVELRRIRVENQVVSGGLLGSEIEEFDTAEETFWPIKWWRLRQLRRAMRQPIRFVKGEAMELLDDDLEERFGQWPHVYRFVRRMLGEVLFAHEFIMEGREIEARMTFVEPIHPQPGAPTAVFEVQEIEDGHVTVGYSSEWLGDGREGHFSGYMEWERDNALLYHHIGMDIFSVPADGDGRVVTILRHDIDSTRFYLDQPRQDQEVRALDEAIQSPIETGIVSPE